MVTEREFKTRLYRENAVRTYGRKGRTTLRRTGLEDVMKAATSRNLTVLEDKGGMGAREFEKFKKEAGPHEVWAKLVELELDKQPGAKRIINMSLGDPSGYSGYPPNADLWKCMGEICQDEARVRTASRYTGSFGYPPLLRKMQRATFSDPRSILSDPEKFEGVKVYLTTGSSFGSNLAMGPLLLTPVDAMCAPDWTYIIHYASAFGHNAHVESYRCRDDGRPDANKLEEVLSARLRDRNIRVVVFTPIGNPNGATMSRADIVEHFRKVEKTIVPGEPPTVMMVDSAYEAFRRDGKPQDPIEIAIDEGIKAPVIVLDSASKGYGLCGLRLGKTAVYWPEDVAPEYRHDFFLALENDILPYLGVVSVPVQVAMDMFLERLSTDPALMARTVEFFNRRRQQINDNTLLIASALRDIEGVYVSPYYTHRDRLDHIDPDTISSFYVMGGFTRLSTSYGSELNQVVEFGKWALETEGASIIAGVPSQAFLAEKDISRHPGMMRVTGLTGSEDTAEFLRNVEAYGKRLGK